MTRKDPNMVLFQAEIARHTDVVNTQPVGQGVLISSLASLEQSGLNLLSKGGKDTVFYAETMHGAYAALSGIEVVPPFNEEQKGLHIGKMSVYKTLMETFIPKQKQTRSTPTEATKTDDRKK